MKICIVSDSHDRAEPLARAVQAAKELGAEAVIRCGDVIGTQTLRAALGVGLPMHVILGNSLGDPISLSRWARESNGQLDYRGRDARLELAGRKIFVAHYPNSCRSPSRPPWWTSSRPGNQAADLRGPHPARRAGKARVPGISAPSAPLSERGFMLQ